MLDIHENLLGNVSGYFVDYSHEVLFNHMVRFKRNYRILMKRPVGTAEEETEAWLRHVESFRSLIRSDG